MSEQIQVSWVKCALDTVPLECTANGVIKATRTGGKDHRLRQQVTQIRNRFECELALFPGDIKKAKEAIGELKNNCQLSYGAGHSASAQTTHSFNIAGYYAPILMT